MSLGPASRHEADMSQVQDAVGGFLGVHGFGEGTGARIKAVGHCKIRRPWEAGEAGLGPHAS